MTDTRTITVCILLAVLSTNVSSQVTEIVAMQSRADRKP
jgi:hypothetical protein